MQAQTHINIHTHTQTHTQTHTHTHAHKHKHTHTHTHTHTELYGKQRLLLGNGVGGINYGQLKHNLDLANAKVMQLEEDDCEGDLAAEIASAKVNVAKAKKEMSNKTTSQKPLDLVQQRIAQAPGPFVRALQRWEKKCAITHEFYHGGSFNGNTCQVVLLKISSLLLALSPLLVLAPDVGVQTTLVGDGVWVQTEVIRWNKLVSLEELYSANRPLCAHEVQLFDGRATDFGMWLPTTFPKESLPPKFHILVCEMPYYAKLMAKHGQSIGKGNEQSIEGVHVKYNKQADMHRNSKCRRRKLTRMHRSRSATTHSKLQSQAGVGKKRKFADPERAHQRDVKAQER
jgi:hypothetical protein